MYVGGLCSDRVLIFLDLFHIENIFSFVKGQSLCIICKMLKNDSAQNVKDRNSFDNLSSGICKCPSLS